MNENTLYFFICSCAKPKSDPLGDWCIAPLYNIKLKFMKVSTFKNIGKPSFSFNDFHITTQAFSDKNAI